MVAFAFGLAASTFFPVIVLGIFSTRMNKQGAAAGMVTGLLFTANVVWFRFLHPELDTEEHWWFGIGPKGIGSVGMLPNFVVSVAVGACFPAPRTQDMVRAIRVPKGAGAAASH